MRVERVQLERRLGALRVGRDVPVDGHLGDLAREQPLLEEVRLAGHLRLEGAGLHRLDDPAQALHVLHLRADLVLHLVRQPLDVVGAAQRVHRVGDPGLLRADLHGAERDELGFRRRDRVRLVIRRQGHGLGARQRRRQGEIRAPHDVVLGLLGGERGSAAADERAEHHGARVTGPEPLLHHPRVHPPARAELRHLLEELAPAGEVEGQARREVVGREPPRPQQLRVGGRDREAVGHLLGGGAPGLTDVVAADRDGVDPRRPAGAELRQVDDQAQRRLHRVDPGAARDELLEDVVLRRRDDPVPPHALLLGHHHVHGLDDRRHGVDGQRHAHAVAGDPVEGLLHVGQAVDGHADAAHLALGAGVVGVEPELGRQVEGHVEGILPAGHQVLEARIALARGAEADVLAHGPHPGPVHLAVDAPGERELPRRAQVAGRIEPREVLRTIDRLHRNAGVKHHVLRVLGVSHGQPRPLATPSASCRNALMMSGSGVPIGKTAHAPACRSFSTSGPGIVPPTATRMSPAPAAASSATTLRHRSSWAPDSTESPITSTSSWMASLTTSAGVRLRPV